jgi:hypothetical protein
VKEELKNKVNKLLSQNGSQRLDEDETHYVYK